MNIKTLELLFSTIFVLMFGCGGSEGGNGSNGAQGPVGPAGPAGPPGVSTIQFVCKDANGTLVFDGDRCIYLDSSGVQWQLDAETAKPADYSSTWPIFYAGAACTGAEYIYPFNGPRVAFKPPGDSAFRSRPDNLQSSEVPIESYKSSPSAACAVYQYTQRLIPLQAILNTAPLNQPTLSFVPPLRMEPK